MVFSNCIVVEHERETGERGREREREWERVGKRRVRE